MFSSAQAAKVVATPLTRRVGAPARRLDVQGLRALAVLMVVAFHARLPVSGGFVGVDVFFVISGFVITAMLMREWDTTGGIRLVRFYVRRFKRLTPALALTVGVVMVATVLLSPIGSQQIAAKTAMGAMLLAANAVIVRTTGDYFDAPAEANPLLNTWSLSVEEQFYLVFPAILLIGWLLGRRARRPQFVPVVVVGAVGAVSFALAMAGSVGIEIPLMPDWFVGFYGPATRAWEFAVGALLALGGTRLAVFSPRRALPLMIAGAGMLAASLWFITDTTPFPGVWTLLPVAGTLLLIAAGSSDTVVARALASGPMVAIGNRSYSIYLWHWPFIVFAGLLWPGSPLVLLAAAVSSFIPAYASYRWVEQPIRALPHSGGVPLARLVAVTLIPPLALAGTLGFAAQYGFWLPAVRDYQDAMQPSFVSKLAGCHETIPMDQLQPGDCTWNATATGRPIYLVGDSNAEHFSDGIVLAAQELNRPVIISTASGCPFVDIPLVSVSDVGRTRECRAFVQGTLSHLASSTQGTVIISAADQYWASEEYRVGAAFEEDTKLRALGDGLTSTVTALEQAGHSVLLIQSIPGWTGEDALAQCSVLGLLANFHGCSQEMPLERAMERQGATRGVISAVAATTDAEILDPWQSLCSNKVCTSTDNGLVRYLDGAHITVDQSVALAGTFAIAIAAGD